MCDVLGMFDCSTQEVSICVLLVLSLDCHTQKRTLRTQSQYEVSLKHHYNCAGSHNTICSKLDHLLITLEKGRKYAESLAHSQV